MSTEPTFKNYLVSYRYEGAQWCITIPAASHEDAEKRLSQLVFGKVDGELMATIRIPSKRFAWIVDAFVRLIRLIKGGK